MEILERPSSRTLLRVARGEGCDLEKIVVENWYNSALAAGQEPATEDLEAWLREAEEEEILQLISDEVVNEILKALKDGPEDAFAALTGGEDISELVDEVIDPDSEAILSALSGQIQIESGGSLEELTARDFEPPRREHAFSAYQEDILDAVILECLKYYWDLQPVG